MSYTGTPTLYGERQIAAAYQSGQRLAITQIAVGDGNGAAVSPTEGMTALVNEVWRGAITSWGVDPVDPRRIVVHTTIPATAGPFVVREGAIFDSAGGMVAITALAATEIVAPGTSNQATALDLTIALPIGSAGAITVSPGQGERVLTERLIRTPFISINSASVTLPPANPAVGDLYIVPQGAAGAWATAPTGTIAEWNGTFWAFIAPPLKMVAGIMDSPDDGGAEYLKWNGAAWEPFAGAGCIFSVIDTAGLSTPDELVGTASPGLIGLLPNMLFRWRQGAKANATAAPNGNVNGIGDKPFTKADGSALAVGDLPPGDFVTEFDGTRHRVLGPRPSDILAQVLANTLSTTAVQQIIAANAVVPVKINVTLWVRCDSTAAAPDGSANDVAHAFPTIAAAAAYGASKFNFSSFALILRLGVAGTYAPPGPIAGVPNLQIISDTGNAAAFVVSGGVAGSTSLFNIGGGCTCTLSGFTVNVTAAANGWVSCGPGGGVYLTNLIFSDSVTSTSPVIGAGGSGANVTIGPGITINAVGAAALMSASLCGTILMTAYINMVGGSGFGTTVTVSDGGRVIIPSNVGFTGAGATMVVGTRYSTGYGGSINVGGAGPKAIPGNVDGQPSTTGGFYG